MNLEKLVSVSKLPGVFRVVKNKNNGLIVQNLDNGKKRFVSSRNHQFTPLETISIYRDDDETTELKDVFKTIKDKITELPPITSASTSEEAKKYFEQILPSYDRERVYVSDIKKIAKWFTYLNDKGLLEDTGEEEVAEEIVEEATTEADEPAK